MDELTQRLTALRHKLAPAWSAARKRRAFDEIVRLQRQRRTRTRALVAGGGLLVLLSCIWLRHAPDSPTPPAAGSAPREVAEAPPIAAGAVLRRGPPLRLRDGSRVDLSGELVVDANEPLRVALRVRIGKARFEVVPNARRTFTVQASETTISVVGTSFEVERAAERVRVAVDHGAVRVSCAGEEVYVRAGEARWFGAVPPAAAKPNAPRAAMDDARRAPRAGAEVAPSASWRSLARSGDYAAAFRRLRPRDLASADPETLLDAAETARLSGHPEAAVDILRRVLREHGRDPNAPLAAFTLGRVLLERLGRPAEAADAFAAARSLAPHGSLAEDALAREVEAWSKAGRVEQAYARARTFMQRYPTSRRARVVQRYAGM